MNKTKKYKYLRKNRHSKRSKHGNKNKKTRRMQRGGEPGNTAVDSGNSIYYTGNGTAAIQAQRLLSRNTTSSSPTEEEKKKRNALRMKELKERHELDMQEYKRNRKEYDEATAKQAVKEKAAAAVQASSAPHISQDLTPAPAAVAAQTPEAASQTPPSEIDIAQKQKEADEESKNKEKPNIEAPFYVDKLLAYGAAKLTPGTPENMNELSEEKRLYVLSTVNDATNENYRRRIEYYTMRNNELLTRLESLNRRLKIYESKYIDEELIPEETETKYYEKLQKIIEQIEKKMIDNTKKIGELDAMLGANPMESMAPLNQAMMEDELMGNMGMVPQTPGKQKPPGPAALAPQPPHKGGPVAAAAEAAKVDARESVPSPTGATTAAEKAQPSRPPVPTTRPPPLVPTVLPQNEIVARRKAAEKTGHLEKVNPKRFKRKPGLTGKIKNTFKNAATATRRLFNMDKSPEYQAEKAAAAAAKVEAEAKRKEKAQSLKDAQIKIEQTAKHKLTRKSSLRDRVIGGVRKFVTTNPFSKTQKQKPDTASSSGEPSPPPPPKENTPTPPPPTEQDIASPPKDIPVPTRPPPPPPSAQQESPRARPPPPTNRPPRPTSRPSSQGEPSPSPPPTEITAVSPLPLPSPIVRPDGRPNRPLPAPPGQWSMSTERAWNPDLQFGGNITRKNRQYIHEIKNNRTHLFNKEMEIINSIRNFKHGHGPNEHGKNKPENIQKKFIKVIKRS